MTPLPCPFCGSKKVQINFAGLCASSKQHYAQCEDCTGDGPWGESEEDAIAQWNTRVSVRPEALRSERECPTCGAYEGDHLYCKTCGSCGEDGCCPPEKCQKARRDETIEECAALAEAQSFPFGEDYMSALQIAQAIRALKTTPSPRGKQ